jgi:hypothetical protein
LNQLRGAVVISADGTALRGESRDEGGAISETVTAGYHLSYVVGRAIAVLLATVSAICG